MPARIGPGPNNPLGTHAVALNAEGILIPATPDVGSIGFNASHGCVRMAPADEEDLFGRVGVGTPVAIVTAGPPKPRVATPAPAAPQPQQPAPPAPAATPAPDAAVHLLRSLRHRCRTNARATISLPGLAPCQGPAC